MDVIAVTSQKGGAGKTTLSCHCATLASEHGPTLLIDLDPQKSAVEWHEARTHEPRTNSGPLLADITEGQLPEALELAENEGIETVIIDTPPHNARSAVMATKSANLVVVPTRPSIVDLRALRRTIDMLEEAKVRPAFVINSAPPQRGVARAPVVIDTREVLRETGYPVWDGQLTQRQAFSEAMVNGSAVHEYEAKGKAAAEIRDLWRWIQSQLAAARPGSAAAANL